MSIFRKASDLNAIPDAISNAYFDNNDIEVADEFSSLFKEASDVNTKSVYENRLKSFKKAQAESHEFAQPAPAVYSESKDGIRRIGHGQRFPGEHSELFGSEQLRSINYDNNKYAENLLNNGFSIWEPEFDELQDAFSASQKQSDAIFERRSAAEKKALNHKAWEKENLNTIRKANVLPYRGLGISRLANEQPIHHGDFNSVNDFYADAQDSIREMIKESNTERKAKISRKGVDPMQKRSEWENKESIAARTMESLQNSSFLAEFAEGISLDD
jgi:hypothetical protein